MNFTTSNHKKTNRLIYRTGIMLSFSAMTFLSILLPLKAESSRADLSWIQSHAVVLQGDHVEELKNSTYDLIIMDYSSDGRDENAFTKEQINSIKNSGKLVLCYFSIAELEDYRNLYWRKSWKKGNPSFIGPENENWPGNHRAKYWKKKYWKKVLKPYLDKIAAAGFNGIFIDVVDTYYYWGVQDNKLRKRANQMIKLINKTAEYMRIMRGKDFIILPQNGLSIIDDASSKLTKKYINIIDGICLEDLYYNIWNLKDQKYRLNKLSEINSANKLIINIEYIDKKEYNNYLKLWNSNNIHLIGYPAAPDRALNEVIYY